jgi:hypothetical protein
MIIKLHLKLTYINKKMMTKIKKMKYISKFYFDLYNEKLVYFLYIYIKSPFFLFLFKYIDFK